MGGEGKRRRVWEEGLQEKVETFKQDKVGYLGVLVLLNNRHNDCDSDGVAMTGNQIEQRESALARSYGVCAVCGKPLTQGQVQYAHKIANKEVWRKKFGSWVIDNTLNGEMVCSLGCNQSVDVGSSYGNQLEVIGDILIAEYVKMWGAEGLGKLSYKLIEKYRIMGAKI